MQRLLFHTFLLIAALMGAAWLLAPEAAGPANKSAPAEALLLRDGKSPAGNGFADEEIVIERDTSGQFHLDATVDGHDIRFLVDTGADVVALTVADAERLGLDVREEEFQPIMQTASGIGYGARVRLDRLGLGDIEFDGVDAVVVKDLGVNLLGQSALRRLGKVELRGDRMVIAHP